MNIYGSSQSKFIVFFKLYHDCFFCSSSVTSTGFNPERRSWLEEPTGNQRWLRPQHGTLPPWWGNNMCFLLLKWNKTHATAVINQ